ncbi:uncharacterized protein TRAVEDRAFT_29508 [Trametes versicolor FP-101664 SS1]|uniref:uncharacterized protein n=1 Tax=Trametes versicolor (strain FP-101664) TaxID=717944 RepID=UPI00046218E8|nr:uncharacterized protein TRAVEDRAFT_29508 [Trametes versicolor FP-101664 SS1]EIW57398.1 hypothetical protein TRAVEDRAFT_29508 [Trametes versicolor FP-101664 SS1]
MHIARHAVARQDTSVAGLSGAATVAATASDTALIFNTDAAAATAAVTAPPLADGQTITLTSSGSSSSATSTPSSSAVASAVNASKSSQLPLGSIIAICVGAFIGILAVIFFLYAWFRRRTDKLSASARRNAEGAQQQRTQPKNFNRLGDSEKRAGGNLPPPSPAAQDPHDSDEKNFSMFKKSPSVRTAYTTKTTTDEDQAMDLPQLDFTKYHPTLAQELSFENPDKPFARPGPGRQNSGVSWDGETLGDDSFLSMHSMRVDSGAMSPTMVMAKMTPPATTSAIHKWESAEVLIADEDAAAQEPSRNPFAEMAEERRARNNPFFNAQDMNRNSRAIRSRSNSRTSRTSRAQSMVRQSTNPFIDLHEAVPVSSIEAYTPDTLYPNSGLPNKASVPSGASASAFGNDRAMASLIAALDLTKEEVEERLRVVSMQGSMVSAYSNDESDIATVREFPLPPGTTSLSP